MDFGNYLTFVFDAQSDLHLYLTFSFRTRFICQARAGAGLGGGSFPILRSLPHSQCRQQELQRKLFKSLLNMSSVDNMPTPRRFSQSPQFQNLIILVGQRKSRGPAVRDNGAQWPPSNTRHTDYPGQSCCCCCCTSCNVITIPPTPSTLHIPPHQISYLTHSPRYILSSLDIMLDVVKCVGILVTM